MQTCALSVFCINAEDDCDDLRVVCGNGRRIYNIYNIWCSAIRNVNNVFQQEILRTHGILNRILESFAYCTETKPINAFMDRVMRSLHCNILEPNTKTTILWQTKRDQNVNSYGWNWVPCRDLSDRTAHLSSDSKETNDKIAFTIYGQMQSAIYGRTIQRMHKIDWFALDPMLRCIQPICTYFYWM